MRKLYNKLTALHFTSLSLTRYDGDDDGYGQSLPVTVISITDRRWAYRTAQEGQLFSAGGTTVFHKRDTAPPCAVVLSEVFGQFQNVVMGFFTQCVLFFLFVGPVRLSVGPMVRQLSNDLELFSLGK
jgi:hypothetical protein